VTQCGGWPPNSDLCSSRVPFKRTFSPTESDALEKQRNLQFVHLECGDMSPLSIGRDASRLASAVVPAHSKGPDFHSE